MSTPETLADAARSVRLASGQCLTLHLETGAVVLVEHGRIEAIAAPRWLAGRMTHASRLLGAGELVVIDAAGWHGFVAQQSAQLRIVAPAPRPGLWRLIKSRFGRSGLLLGNSRPPDTKAAEQSVPHATSQ